MEERVKITDEFLDKLGYTEYHDGAGDYGERKLRVKLSNGLWYTLSTVYCMDNLGDNYFPEGNPYFANENFEPIEFVDEIIIHVAP